MADTEQEVKNGPTPSRSILAKPKLFEPCSGSSDGVKSNPFAKSTSGSVLRPPQLKPASIPATIFSRVPDDPDNETKETSKTEEKIPTSNENDDKEEAPKFVPLGTAAVHRNVPLTVTATSTTTSVPDFVFGQNLSSRVFGGVDQPGSSTNSTTPHANTNGSTSEETSKSELLFTSAASSIEHKVPFGSSAESTSQISSAESSRPQPPPACTTPFTGEEGEHNVLQISCRLFAWEGSWRERGRVMVRLNDLPTGGARLLARTCGSFRLIVNTKLWADMTCERPSSRCLRVTTNPTLMLLMGAPNDIGHLHKAMSTRISALKEADESGPSERVNGNEGSDQLPNEPSVDHPDEKDKNDELIDDDDSSKQTEEEQNDLNESRESLKRKEAPDDSDTSPKRQCPKVIVK